MYSDIKQEWQQLFNRLLMRKQKHSITGDDSAWHHSNHGCKEDSMTIRNNLLVAVMLRRQKEGAWKQLSMK
jgi:hypothetical protein